VCDIVVDFDFGKKNKKKKELGVVKAEIDYQLKIQR